jgi:hypothetical protein
MVRLIKYTNISTYINNNYNANKIYNPIYCNIRKNNNTNLNKIGQ